MKIALLIFLVFFNFNIYAICNTSHKFWNRNKGIGTGAIGKFLKKNNKLYFKPLICLNNKDCNEIDLSDYPFTYKNVPISRLGSNSEIKEDHTLQTLITEEEAFQKGINLQNIKIKEVFKNREKNKKSRFYYEVEECFIYTSSIFLVTNYFYNKDQQSLIPPKEHTLTLPEITYKDDSLKGCGCEDLFNPSKHELENYDHYIKGFYFKENNKLYFKAILDPKEASTSSSLERNIEIKDKDKCNPYVNEILNKKITLNTMEKIDPNKLEIPFINACRSRIYFQK